MRRLFLPVVVLAVAIVASVLAGRANDAAEPDDPSDVTVTDSLGTPLLSVRRAPEWLRQPTTSDLLDRAVREPVAATEGSAFACLSVHVDGQPVTDVAGDVPFIPGSIQRLLVLAALDTVGTGGFTTEVVRAADAVITEDGVLEGDLYLIGRGDPVLSTNAFISQFTDGRSFTSLEELALSTIAALEDAGITSVTGNVVGVDGRYEGSPQSLPDTWTAAEVRSGEVGVTGGLVVNNGITNVPDPADPAANVRTSDPALHAATEFAALLEAPGVLVGGGATGEVPDATNREAVASISSPPMEEIAARAVVDGTTAEMLWREVAVRSGLSADNIFDLLGSVNAALDELGLVDGETVAGTVPKVDGSGLSLNNRNLCNTHTGVLAPQSSALASSALPAVADSPMAACAPTGLASLHLLADARPEVTSMAGWAEAANGDIVSFSLIANWLPDGSGVFAERTVCDDLLPAVLDAISAHPAGPALDQLTPLDPVPAE